MLALLAGCAQAPSEPAPHRPPEPQALPQLPATFESVADCPGCLAVTLTVRPDGSYLVRDRLGASEFYDFGRWRYADGVFELAGGREAPRRLALHALRRAPQVEVLRGPFRMTGLYDGAVFKECRTGIGWPLSDTRAAQTLSQEYRQQARQPALVALDAQFEGSPEALRVLRPASLLNAAACPG